MKVIRRDPDKAYLDRYLWIPKYLIDVNSVKSALTYESSSAYGAEGHTRIDYLWKEAPAHLLIPRAFWDPVRLPCPVIDCRPRQYPTINFTSRIKLDHKIEKTVGGHKILVPTGNNIQRLSLEALESSQGGVLQLTCGRGKTIIALEFIARRCVPALILVDNTQLLYQWQKEINACLVVPGGVGVYALGKKEWQHGIVLATYHSIANWADTIPEEARRWFGLIFFEEGHHCPAPLFSKTADMFYGMRISLTATPERTDGRHVLSEGHVGPIVYKNLTPLLLPTFSFIWSGVGVDMKDPTVAPKVVDVNGEVHLSKLSSYFGQCPPRVNLLLRLVHEARQNKRVVLVLSNSVDEVVNLTSCWERPGHPLYTDIPLPTPADVGEQLSPLLVPPKDLKKMQRRKACIEARLTKGITALEQQTLRAELVGLQQIERQVAVARKLQNELERRQRAYIHDLLAVTTQAGLLTYEVDPGVRNRFVAERDVIFSITKYGKEGYDCQRLDTIILSSLFSQQPGLQQLLGRPTRPEPDKKTPLLLGIVDDVGQCIGMAKKLISHLRSWPAEEGGPYEPILVGFPSSWKSRMKPPATTMELFGR
jgi:hypothetical protein